MTKKYIIRKIVFANNISELMSLENCGEIIDISLQDEILDSAQIGFNKKDAKRTRDNLV